MQNPQLQYYQAQARFAQLAHVQAQQQMLKYAQLQATQAQAIATATAAQLAMQQAAFANSTSGRSTPCVPSASHGQQVSLKRTAIHGDVKLCELGELSKLLLVWGTTDLTVLAREFGSFSPMSIGLVYPAKSKGSCALIKFNTINEAMNAKANLPLSQFVIHYAHQPITITARSSKARRASAATAANAEIARAVKSGLQLEDFDSDTPAEWGSSRPPAMSRSGVSTPSSFSPAYSAFTSPGASSFSSPGTSAPASPYLRGMTSPSQHIPTASFTPAALYLQQQQQQLHLLQQQLQKQASAPPSPSETVAVAGAPSTAAFAATKPSVEEKTTTTLSELVAADTTSESSEEGSSSDETSSTISEESTTVPEEASTPTRRTRKKKTKSHSSRSSRAVSWRSSHTAVAPRVQVAKGPVKGSIGFAARKARMAKAPRANSWSRPLQTTAPFEKTVVADLGGIGLD